MFSGPRCVRRLCSSLRYRSAHQVLKHCLLCLRACVNETLCPANPLCLFCSALSPSSPSLPHLWQHFVISGCNLWIYAPAVLRGWLPHFNCSFGSRCTSSSASVLTASSCHTRPHRWILLGSFPVAWLMCFSICVHRCLPIAQSLPCTLICCSCVITAVNMLQD